MKADIQKWTDAELGAICLSQLWRWYDAGGISEGRSYEAMMLEAARSMLSLSHPEDSDPDRRPDDFVLLQEVLRRMVARTSAAKSFSEIHLVMAGLEIFARHGGLSVHGEHDVIYSGPAEGSKLSAAELDTLKRSNWVRDSCACCGLPPDAVHPDSCVAWMIYT